MPVAVLSPTGGGIEPRSRRSLRRLLGARLTGYDEGTVTAASTALDLVISSDFQDHEADETAYRGWLRFDVGALSGTQRRLRTTGHVPLRGEHRLARPLGSAATVGMEFAKSELLPIDDADGVRGLHWCINEALARLTIIDRLPITSTGAYTYSLAAYDWLRGESQVLGVLWDASATATPAPNPLAWPHSSYRYDAETRSLDLRSPIGSGDTFYIEVYRPAHTRILVNGTTWTDVTEGLTADDDETIAPPGSVVELAYYFALRQIVQRLRTAADISRWRPELLMQGETVKRILMQQPGRYRSRPTKPRLVAASLPAAWQGSVRP